MDKIFIDTDIALDLLSEREPHYHAAAILFSKADRKELHMFVSALTFANLNYMLSKQHTAQQARKILSKFKTLITVLPVDDKTVELALVSDFKDFEDALQYHTCIQHNLETLITRNTKDYRKASIVILSAEEYLKQGL